MEKQLLQRGPTEGRWIAQSGDLNRFLAVSENTGGAYAQWEAIVPPGGGPRLHVHSREDESFYVLEGEVQFLINGVPYAASAGTYVSLPAGSSHRFRNESTSVARLLITVTPGGLEGLFFEAGIQVAPGTAVAPRPTKDEKEKIRAAAPRYGITLLPE
jgi:quercetin dioxygenase-like cupin family protein